jgi:hypothetical protein
VTVRVYPERRAIVDEEVVENERLDDRNTATVLDIEERDAAIERWKQVVCIRAGSVVDSDGAIVVCTTRGSARSESGR